MDYAAIAQALLAIITNAPSVISEAETIYSQIKSELSATDQSSIDLALANAKAADATATEAADTALDSAAKE